MSVFKFSRLTLVLVPVLASCGKNVSTYTSNPSELESELESNLASCEAHFQQPFALAAGRHYASCQDVKTDYELSDKYQSCRQNAYSVYSKKRNRHSSSRPVASAAQAESGNSASNKSGSDILTNVRHEDVDEADFVKFSAHQIFVSDGGKINVIDRKSKKHIGALALNNSDRTFVTPNLLVKDNKLIAIGGTFVLVYELSEKGLPTFREERQLKGINLEARLVGDKIVVVSSMHMRTLQAPNNMMSDEPDISELPCAKIRRPQHLGELNRSYTQIEVLPVANLSDAQSQLTLGNFRLYMTNKNIYLFSNFGFGYKDASVIEKYSLSSSGNITHMGTGHIKGRIKDVWALSELPGGELAVASTSGSLFDNSALNHFTILRGNEQKLEIIGETPPYGAKEDIRSVRFVGNTAYVVTFKKTDPLFAIDVSEPQQPKILGELKIPGFSTYMHPLDKNSLIGLGFDASDDGEVAYFQGLQLSLFETDDPMKMKRKAVEIFGVRGSSSAAIRDHRAFFLDKSAGVLAFPVDLRLECAGWDSRCQPLAKPFPHFTGMKDFFSGAAVVRVNNSGFAEPLFISNKDLLPDSCIEKGPRTNWWQNTNSEDIQRIYKIDGEMMSVSKSGLKVFRVGAGLETLQSSFWNASCVTRSLPPRID